MRQEKRSLAELLHTIQLYPQTLINVRFASDYQWQSDAKMSAAISDAEKQLNGQGRVLIRASGTEPVLRVMVEAEDAHLAKAQAEKIAQVIPRQ
jgi:phosphoglucosamine mutase